LTIDSGGRVWATSFAGAHTISTFDSNGKPVSPSEGYNFGGKVGQLQGIIATPGGDIWTADLANSRLIHFPKGDAAKGEILCHNPGSDLFANPCKLLFALAIDQWDNIWVTNGIGDAVTRFPATDPTKAHTFHTGYSGSGLAIDSLGNV
jgi:hypothetical protein